ncbi:MAG: SUMF1/EgtB/PvdO family nonheme iron enzyme, partial [Candidatus Competibacteraceae bacterium]|nr:SUMF1/EgtB/PvdO family nonheme iron enzyme [Candidatus Competibacteraceae bacterium]
QSGMLYAGSRPDSAQRVNRGGSWNNKPRRVRSANRNRNTPDNRNNNLGFRLASAPARSGTVLAKAETGVTRVIISQLPGFAWMRVPNSLVRMIAPGAGSNSERSRCISITAWMNAVLTNKHPL